MPMTLAGSCRCGTVSFSFASHTPYPYQLCYCSICRKAGGAGYAINIMALHDSLEIKAKHAIRVFTAIAGGCERSFCGQCSTMLWVWDARWPELMHPFASCIDTDLPDPPLRVHILLEDKPEWVQPDIRENDQAFDGYPEQSIEDWHKTRGLWID